MAENRLKEPGFERRVSRISILSVLPLQHSLIQKVRVRDSMNLYFRLKDVKRFEFELSLTESEVQLRLKVKTS